MTLKPSPFGPMPPLNALRAFEASARLGAFAAAAEELGVTQGAVAQQVRALEAVLGEPLFERRARGLALTTRGEAFVEPVRRAFELIGQATASAAAPAARRTAVTLSVPPTFAARWLVPRLERFTRRHPTVDVRILAVERRVRIGPRGEADLGVRYGVAPFEGLVADRLESLPLVPVCTPAYADRHGLAGGPARLAGAVLLHDAHALWPSWLAAFGAGGIDASRGLRFSQTTLALDAALGGQGVALAPEPFVASDLREGRLAAPFGPERVLASAAGLWVVAAPGRRTEPVEAMRAWLVEEAAENAR
ncbi:LysR substrate-binding domain-containing protein [Salinarimonas chemoclinalis]|uniref:LysR substrate-binding domain-containing protein n=1 Tax=Salinarimonas chemoclinalis TaxID=3241599 RepID=UPI0035582D93